MNVYALIHLFLRTGITIVVVITASIQPDIEQTIQISLFLFLEVKELATLFTHIISLY
ncbi:MAG: hypothetical protein ACXACF_01605 [Candidatus Hermodarchaeia archaeon]|jgi:hypothetical protein